MKNIIEQIQSEEDCPVRNCNIGESIQCHVDEVRDAVQFGKHKFQRNASYHQRHPDVTGCENYSLKDVEIIYDKEGNAIDYNMSYADPEQILDFTLIAGLVPYGTDMQGVFTGIRETPGDGGQWGELAHNFNDLAHSVQQANRHFFPPDRIMVDGKPYEVAAVTICDNLTCIYNSGKTQIAPLPLVSK